jgi:hypothetical protein
MGYVVATSLPVAEPVSLARMKNYLRIDAGFIADDEHIAGLISAAREHAERITGKAIAQRTWRQVLDSMPYYTDAIQSQLAYPPSYYSLPAYSTTLWNYSQMIKLFYPPVISVQQIRFIDSNGNADTLNQDTDFILDRISQPARIFPIAGQYWPPNLYVPNSCEIDFTAGYGPPVATGSDTGNAGIDTHEVKATPPSQQPDSVIVTACPHTLVRIIMLLAGFWFDNRAAEAPPEIDAMLAAEACIDFAPSRG